MDFKKEIKILSVATENIYRYMDDHFSNGEFNHIFNVCFSLYQECQKCYQNYIKNPHSKTITVLGLYKTPSTIENWHNIIESALGQRKKKDKYIRKFLSLSQEEKINYARTLNEEDSLWEKFQAILPSMYSSLFNSYLGIYLTTVFYNKQKTIAKKFAYDVFWNTSYLVRDDNLTIDEKREIFHYSLEVLEKIPIQSASDIISCSSNYGDKLKNALGFVFRCEFYSTWILNTLVYSRPYVQPHHVKLLYETFPPNRFRIEYSIQGLAYFGQTDMECRRLAYEGLEKFVDLSMRQQTIENMKSWYGDFPRDLYEKYTKEYNEITGENLKY